MNMYITCRMQIFAALDRVRARKQPEMTVENCIQCCQEELFREFGSNTVSVSESADFLESVKAFGYVKLEPGQVIIGRDDLTRLLDNIDDLKHLLNKVSGYGNYDKDNLKLIDSIRAQMETKDVD